jgi:hypothetical protein
MLPVTIDRDHDISFQFSSSFEASSHGASIAKIPIVANHLGTELLSDKGGLVLTAIIDHYYTVDVPLCPHNNLSYFALFVESRNARYHSPPVLHRHIHLDQRTKNFSSTFELHWASASRNKSLLNSV